MCAGSSFPSSLRLDPSPEKRRHDRDRNGKRPIQPELLGHDPGSLIVDTEEGCAEDGRGESRRQKDQREHGDCLHRCAVCLHQAIECQRSTTEALRHSVESELDLVLEALLVGS